jgi:hypothetical protein
LRVRIDAAHVFGSWSVSWSVVVGPRTDEESRPNDEEPRRHGNEHRTSEERMGLATTVSIVVICVMVIVGVIGFAIDRHASKLER